MATARSKCRYLLVLGGLSIFLACFVTGAWSQGTATRCILAISEGTRAGSVFQDGRTPNQEYELLSMVYFLPGEHVLPMTQGEHSYELFNGFEFGPGRTVGVSSGPGRLSLSITRIGMTTHYTYTFRKSYMVGLREMNLNWEQIWFRDDGGGIQGGDLILVTDEEYMSIRIMLFGSMNMGGVWPENFRYASPRYGALPLWAIVAETGEGDYIELRERFSPPMVGSGPANLTEGRVDILEGRATVTDYWHLVYAAEHHNWDPTYWVILDPPLDNVFIVAVHIATFVEPPDRISYVRMLTRDFRLARDTKLKEIRKWRILGHASWEIY